MRTLLRISLIAVLIVSLVEIPVFGAPSRSLGVVVQAERARISSADAASGVTLFDGDTLATDATGTLRVRLGETQFSLLANSAAALRQTAAGVSARLQSGTAVFASARPEAFELLASEARIHARTTQPTLAQVTMVGPYELLLTCQRGELEVRIGEEIHQVPEATSYRVIIEPAPAPAQGGGRPLPTARSKWLLVALILIGVGTGIGIWRALISPSAP